MKYKKWLRALLFPPAWLIFLLTVACGVLLTMVFVKGWEESIPAYVVYAASFYTLVVACLYGWLVLPGQYRRITQKINATPLGNRYMTDRAFRAEVALHISLGISLLYVAVNVWSWYIVRSWWFVVLAVYYVILAVMRFLLVGYVRRNDIGTNQLREWRRSRVCAGILLLVNISLTGAVMMILYQNRGYEYPGMLIYVMALYTFYSVIHAIMDMVSYRHLGSPVVSTAKIVSLSAALVSLLNLETAMFAQFGGDMSPGNRRLFIILTGAGVSVTVVTLSVLRIVKATKEIRRYKNGE
jgi:hypothetical protein